MTTIEKIKWIANANPDPRRSQLRKWIPSFLSINSFHNQPLSYDVLLSYFDKLERYEVIWYDQMASIILDYLNGSDPNLSSLKNWELVINSIFEDINQDNKWGFIFDW